jgi:hypothetical protein
VIDGYFRGNGSEFGKIGQDSGFNDSTRLMAFLASPSSFNVRLITQVTSVNAIIGMEIFSLLESKD